MAMPGRHFLCVKSRCRPGPDSREWMFQQEIENECEDGTKVRFPRGDTSPKRQRGDVTLSLALRACVARHGAPITVTPPSPILNHAGKTASRQDVRPAGSLSDAPPCSIRKRRDGN